MGVSPRRYTVIGLLLSHLPISRNTLHVLSSCSFNPCLYRFAYNPGSPSSEHKQVAYPWLVDVPDDFTGGKYGALFDAVAMEGSVCLGQGLTLVHFSAQPKPFWSHLPVSPCLIDWGNIMHPTYPTQCATLSRKVDDCKPLAWGCCGRGARPARPRQGLTIVHFSAQHEPSLTQKHILNTHNIP